ncbi:MAG: hypothetical protein Q8P18_26375 [Pseudomonadota bacterium]|nr:hypothetical protein [Pseudomonadota bacterium]
MVWLLACACPTFEGLEVVDLTESGNATALARVAVAVDTFEAWTAREGVCVASVEVVDEVEGPAAFDAEGLNAVGVFQPRARRIEIGTAWFPLAETVTHELCHALDWQEDLSPARPDLFTGEDLDAEGAYPTDESKRAESFALACEVGGVDVSVELAFEEQCGLGPVDELIDPTTRFLAEEVFQAASRLDMSDEPVTLRRREVTLDVGDGRAVESVIGTPTDLYALALEPSRRWDASTLTLSRLDPDTGAARARQTLDLPIGYWRGSLLASDADPLLLVWNAGRDDPIAKVYTIDGDTLVPLDLPLREPWEITGAVTDGVLVVTTQASRNVVTGERYVFGGVGAWDLATGQEHPLSFPEEEWGLSVWADAFLPGPDGLEMIGTDGYSRLDLATDTWSRDPAPSMPRGLLRLGEKRIHFVQVGYEFELVVHDLAEDTWAFAEGACEDTPGLLYAASYAQVGERAFVIPEIWPGVDGLLAWELILD